VNDGQVSARDVIGTLWHVPWDTWDITYPAREWRETALSGRALRLRIQCVSCLVSHRRPASGKCLGSQAKLGRLIAFRAPSPLPVPSPCNRSFALDEGAKLAIDGATASASSAVVGVGAAERG
jgi:hypothetical protein